MGIPSLAASEHSEIRALWVTRFHMRTPEQIDRLVRDAVSANFNTLFVQVRGNGETLYPSFLEPRSPLIKNPSFDPLSYTLQRAHAKGLEVHAWLNVFYVWSKDQPPSSKNHVLLSHPDWVSRYRDGRSPLQMSQSERASRGAEGVFLDPALPEVRTYVLELCREIWRRYAVDGIHLDYFRYAGSGWGYPPESRVAFKRRYGVDPVSLSPKKDPALSSAWSTFRIEQMNVLLSLLARFLEIERPTLKLSAAVFPDVSQAKLLKGQAWDDWLKKEWLDFVVPMAYHPNDEQVFSQVGPILKIPHHRLVVIGLGAWQQKPWEIVRKIEKIRRETKDQDQYGGVSLFSYDRIGYEKGYLSYLKRTIFKNPASLPTFSWKPASDLVQF